MSTVVISVRVRRDIKEELERAGINISEAVRRYLEELAWKVRIARIVSEWDQLLGSIKPSEPGFSVKSVREDRESH